MPVRTILTAVALAAAALLGSASAAAASDGPTPEADVTLPPLIAGAIPGLGADADDD